MNEKAFFRIMDRPIAFHRCFVDLTGSVTAALFLSQAVDWQHWLPKEAGGWWHKTREDWTEETGLSRREQESARRKLRQLGVLEEQRTGAPARLLYRVNRQQLNALLNAMMRGSAPLAKVN
jgi:hypothetical protein